MTPYVVKQRECDGRWCIYDRRSQGAVAEFGESDSYSFDAQTIKAILEGPIGGNIAQACKESRLGACNELISRLYSLGVDASGVDTEGDPVEALAQWIEAELSKRGVA